MDRTISSNLWHKVYFFARDLMSTDSYGSVGKRESILREIVAGCEAIVQSENLTPSDKVAISIGIIHDKLMANTREGTKQRKAIDRFVEYLRFQIKVPQDVICFIVAAKYIVLPTNDALRLVPSDDKNFTLDIARSTLNELGFTGVGKVLALWDELGTNTCLRLEREEVITAFARLRNNLKELAYPHDEMDDNVILTAFIQEFERRLGQKRKSRAGGSLEDVVGFLFDYFKIAAADRPEHFQSDLEVDKWFKCSDGWLVGISCKRTLRERWKQLSSATMDSLATYKVKELWHVITYDNDLSDDKIAMLGRQHQFFYLRSDSEVYKYCKEHEVLKNYVRPLSRFIADIYQRQGRHGVPLDVAASDKASR